MAGGTIPMSGFGAPVAVYTYFDAQNDTWTAPKAGILDLIMFANSSGGNLQVTVIDTSTTGTPVVGAIDVTAGTGKVGSCSFPVIGGHVYKVNTYQNVATPRALFYPLL